MDFSPFLLEQWIEKNEHLAKYDLAASTGPLWRAGEVVGLMSEEEKDQLFDTPLTYRPCAGSESLRHTLADWLETEDEDVQICTGASEALLSLFFQAADGDANVVIPTPGYPPFSAFPETLGLEVRTFAHRPENGFQPDVDEIKSQVDERTQIILVNTPHNPSGAVLGMDVLRDLHDFAVERGIQFVVDEVYHPIYHCPDNNTAASLPQAIVVGDMSKALCMPALRVGWIIDRNQTRLLRHRNARSYFTISNGLFGEALAEIAIKNRDSIFSRAKTTARHNLALLDSFFANHESSLTWTRPEGGFTGFPNLVSGENARTLCERASQLGVVLAPGDCFGYPNHFRLGFGACENGFSHALEILSKVLSN